MKNLKIKIAVSLVLSLSAFTTNRAQIIDDETPIKINTLLLNVPIIASDRNGRNITGLRKEDFIVTQNGERLPIEFFANDDAPINIAIVVDTSGSTARLRGNIKAAVRTFLKVLRPEDKAMIVSFDGKFKILSELTADQKILSKAIDRLALVQLKGSSMYDAINEVINNKFASVKGRKAIILLTDEGVESSDRISKQEFTRMLSESDTVIYPIPFLVKEVPKDSPISMYFDHLKEMAAVTAGKIHYGGSDLQQAFQSIADEMKAQYLIGFYPENGNSNNIVVKVDRENVVIRTKKTVRLKTPNQANK
jgi:Ca-activated chloride channel family protein